MLTTGAAAAAVVSAFHGAANIMSDIYQRQQAKMTTGEQLGRAALCRDSLQTAAESVAIAYTKIHGRSVANKDDGSTMILLEISSAVKGEILESLKIAKQYESAVLDLDRLTLDAITLKIKAMGVLEKLIESPKTPTTGNAHYVTLPVPGRSAERPTSSYSHAAPGSDNQNSQSHDNDSSIHDPNRDSLKRSSIGSKLFRNRNFSVMRKRRDSDRDSMWSWESESKKTDGSPKPNPDEFQAYPYDPQDVPTTIPHSTASMPSHASWRSENSNSSELPGSVGTWDNDIVRQETPPTPLSPLRFPQSAREGGVQHYAYDPASYAALHQGWEAPRPAPPIPGRPFSDNTPMTIPQMSMASISGSMSMPPTASLPTLPQPPAVVPVIPVAPATLTPAFAPPPRAESHRSSSTSTTSAPTATKHGFFSFSKNKAAKASKTQSVQSGEVMGRPSKSNNYFGFCKGAWSARENAAKAFEIAIVPMGMYSSKATWRCKQCYFGADVIGKSQTFDPRVQVDPTTHIRYKWLFLAKSHVKCKSAASQGIASAPEAFGCVFCVDEGKQTGVFGKPEMLMGHISAEHRGASEEVKKKNKAVFGKIPEGYEWELHIPEEVSDVGR